MRIGSEKSKVLIVSIDPIMKWLGLLATTVLANILIYRVTVALSLSTKQSASSAEACSNALDLFNSAHKDIQSSPNAGKRSRHAATPQLATHRQPV